MERTVISCAIRQWQHDVIKQISVKNKVTLKDVILGLLDGVDYGVTPKIYESRLVTVSIRVSISFKKELQREAVKNGLTFAVYLRKRMFGELAEEGQLDIQFKLKPRTGRKYYYFHCCDSEFRAIESYGKRKNVSMAQVVLDGIGGDLTLKTRSTLKVRKRKNVGLRVLPSEIEGWREASKQAGLPMTIYLRSRIFPELLEA